MRRSIRASKLYEAAEIDIFSSISEHIPTQVDSRVIATMPTELEEVLHALNLDNEIDELP
jgi:hypothetical protein